MKTAETVATILAMLFFGVILIAVTPWRGVLKIILLILPIVLLAYLTIRTPPEGGYEGAGENNEGAT
ncbi:hypothetical protein [Thermococcus sp.]|uniref:hypothetical protein n=1 Tax=Thermococcus sp. TaxID=35749 RepID=UPI0025D56BAC|nr:hypothetical protein [Thermococcus sp.]